MRNVKYRNKNRRKPLQQFQRFRLNITKQLCTYIAVVTAPKKVTILLVLDFGLTVRQFGPQMFMKLLEILNLIEEKNIYHIPGDVQPSMDINVELLGALYALLVPRKIRVLCNVCYQRQYIV